MNDPAFPIWQRRLLLTAAPAVILLFVLATLAALQDRMQSTERVQHTYADIGLLRQVRTRLLDAETGQRGYVITGDTTYLEPYREAAQDVHAALDSLAVVLAAHPEQSTALAALRQLVTARLEILQLPIRRRAEGFDAAREQLIAGRGKAWMDQVRLQLQTLELAEQQRLGRELASQQRTGNILLAVLIFGTAVVLTVSWLTRRRFELYEQRLEQSNESLTELNEKLQEQAVELELQTEELQLQTVRLQETSAELAVSNEELRAQQEHLQDLAAELEAANEELREANFTAEERRAEAEAANRVKMQFLTSMSHELRTPLNAIAGYVDLLDLDVHGPLTDRQRQSLQRIRLNGNHLLVLINDILDYARLQAGRVSLRSRTVQLGGIIIESTELVQPLLQAKDIHVGVDPAAHELAVHGDPDRIRQILLNLLTNAAKYSDAGGTIHVSTEIDNGRVRVRIRDSGRGIPADMQQAIFDPFVRLNRDAGGTIGDGVGLGLSISRDLAAAMNGELSVQSNPGEGATFTLTLDRAQAMSA